MILWLLLHTVAAANRGSHRNGHGATPAPTASDPRVRRADALNRWFSTIAHLPARARPLEGWTVSRRRDIQGRMRLVTSGNAKQVLTGGTYRNQSIIVKSSSANHTRDKLGDAVHLELVYLEALRGAPGVPELLGAWREGDHVWYAVADGGRPIGTAGQPGKGTKATVLSSEFIALARHKPLELARALLRCFRSWASAGFLLDDFKAQQFTLDGQGDMYLVDGPSLLRAFPVGEVVYRATSHHRQKNNLAPPPSDCRKNADCPSTKAHHACGVAGDCEAGARGAPESAGLCRAGACVAVGPWTHVFDTASRPWLLPGIVTYAEDSAPRKVLDRVMSKARLADPAKRPTFDAMLAEVERHIM
jgi:hypothetical protein